MYVHLLQAAAGTAPVKTSLSAALQAQYRNQIPRRKNPNKGGTSGRPITVQTNMIPMMFGKNFSTWITHYDIKLDPVQPKFMYRHVFEAVRLKHFPKRYPAFDGRSNVFSAGNLPFGDQVCIETNTVGQVRVIYSGGINSFNSLISVGYRDRSSQSSTSIGNDVQGHSCKGARYRYVMVVEGQARTRRE